MGVAGAAYARLTVCRSLEGHREVIDAIACHNKGAPAGEPDDRAMGRSRGGLTTKIHLAAAARGRHLAIVLTAGQAGDAPVFTEVIAHLRAPRRRGRPRTGADAVLADKTYSSRVILEHLHRRGIRAVIPVPADQRGHRLRRGSRGGRPPALTARPNSCRNWAYRWAGRRRRRCYPSSSRR